MKIINGRMVCKIDLISQLRALSVLVVLLFALSGVSSAGANYIPMPDKLKGGRTFKNEYEWHAAPEYCKARFYPGKSDLYQKWRKKMGPFFSHMHHY